MKPERKHNWYGFHSLCIGNAIAICPSLIHCQWLNLVKLLHQITANEWKSQNREIHCVHLMDVIWLQTKPIILQDLPRRNLLTPIIWQNLMRSIHEIFILCPNQTWDLLTTSIVQNKFPLTSKAEKVFFPLSLLQLRRQMLVGIFLHYRPFWSPKRACLSWIQNLSVEPSSI